MLEYLHIRNLALIEDMALEFGEGINVLTGETGAGKSFILKALGFVLGDKLSVDIVRPGAEKARVEALFSLPDGDLILRRELSAETGRSRFYINDSLSSQDALRRLRDRLISHTSQHAQQQLLAPAFQAALLEHDFPRPELLAQRDDLLERLKKVNDDIKGLVQKQKALADRRELLEMQKTEIEKVDPEAGEEEELERQKAAIKAQENARKSYSRLMGILHGEDQPGLLQNLVDLERLVQQLGADDPNLMPVYENIESFRQDMLQLGNDFKKPFSKISKSTLDDIEERLFEFAQLKRKLKRTMPQILALKDEIEENLSFLDACSLDVSHLKKEEEKLKGELKEVVSQIIPLRHEVAARFSEDLASQLKDLGFSEHLKVLAEFSDYEIWPGVNDQKGRILWSPNPGQNPQPLDKIASGGELSRFLLGLSILNDQNRDVSYIFDEVDAGVGGLTLGKLQEKLQTLAKSHQIILITHWPQLAAKAKTHFQISKTVKNNNTFTICKPLEADERKMELERMAGGGKEGKAMAENLLL